MRISICASEEPRAKALCEKIGSGGGKTFLRPLWEQPQLAWAADVVVLDSDDLSRFQAMGDAAFCPAIILIGKIPSSQEDVVQRLGRAPYALVPWDIPAGPLGELLEHAATHSRMLLDVWYQRSKGRLLHQTAGGSEEPMPAPAENFDFIESWMRHWSSARGMVPMLGEIFQRWIGSERVLILAPREEQPHGDLEIQYCSQEEGPGSSYKDWVWRQAEPWIQDLQRINGLVHKDSAHAQLLRWMEALNVRTMMPLRYQEQFLGLLAFGETLPPSPGRENDSRALVELSGKLAKLLYMLRCVKPAASPSGAVPSAHVQWDALSAQSKELLKRQQLEVIGRMAMRSSHELKNCLVSIRTFTQLFPEKYADEQFRKDFYSVVSKEVERLNGLVEKLLFFAQPVQLKLSQEKITDLISEALTLFAPDDLRDVQLHKIFGHTQPAIWMDRQQMLVVFFHIIQNGLQALGHKGKLVIMTEDHPHPDFPEGVLVIRFVDTGRGLTLKDQDEPFEPFVSTKARGLGLGLTIARRVVEEHGGTIRLDSGKEKGTEVIVCIPRKIPQWGAQSAPRKAQARQ